MSKLPVCGVNGERVGDFTLADELLVLKKGEQAVHDVVEAYRAKQRAGTADTKKRGEVSGGGAKPWKQKGTGRARAGSTRSPIWRGGGTVFGPTPRSYEKKVSKKTAQLAFRRAFSERVQAGAVTLVEKLAVSQPKTKEVAAMLKGLKAAKGALIVLESADRNFILAARNLANVEVTTAAGVHTYQLLRYPMVVIAKGAMSRLEERLKKQSGRTA